MREGYGALWYLCAVGFLKEFRPSESFLTHYLVGTGKNLTQDEVNQDIYPIGTYSTLVLLIMVFLITDILCYKPIIIVHSLAGVTCYCLITFGTTKEFMQAAEVFYGLFLASEVAYSTYMYASCEKDVYQKVTSYTRIALQAGRLISGSTAQFLMSCNLLSLHELNYLSLSEAKLNPHSLGLALSAVFGCLLPPTLKSVYFHRMVPEKLNCSEGNSFKGNADIQPGVSTTEDVLLGTEDSEAVRFNTERDEFVIPKIDDQDHIPSGFKIIWSDFVHAYSNNYTIKWSIWWALANCVYLQVTSYIQNLWQDTVELTKEPLYNGAASATYTIISIVASWVVGQSKFDFNEKKKVAKSLTRDSHGLVFGFNTFIALVLQSILTATVAGKGGLQLSTRLQFLVYGSFYIAIGFGFGLVAFVLSLKECHQPTQKASVPEEEP
ncbi:Thiamine transporter 1 [Frankliniella fusca]|uniref:Thiamine transporter 1 n=1 Tax=Frankliniella fusca TaxID=407009 RepID=A0AAE1L913_9NEOP|nr:Thiamine transporter 1 [Frankliniella fusca]